MLWIEGQFCKQLGEKSEKISNIVSKSPFLS